MGVTWHRNAFVDDAKATVSVRAKAFNYRAAAETYDKISSIARLATIHTCARRATVRGPGTPRSLAASWGTTETAEAAAPNDLRARGTPPPPESRREARPVEGVAHRRAVHAWVVARRAAAFVEILARRRLREGEGGNHEADADTDVLRTSSLIIAPQTGFPADRVETLCRHLRTKGAQFFDVASLGHEQDLLRRDGNPNLPYH